MTVDQLETILSSVKKQIEYEDKCSDALSVLCPDCTSPILSNPLWQACCMAVDLALGLENEDFIAWWIWETDCGKKDNKLYLNGEEIEIKTAQDIINYAKRVNNGN